MKKVVLLSFLFVSSVLAAQDLPAYKIFSGNGKKADYRNIIKKASDADVVFFGELHDNPLAHWLELEIARSLFALKGKDLNLAAEMFETDNQLLIDEYFAGLIRESSFESEVRKWNNYDTDYKPLLNFARDNGLKFVASNVPRRYASMVSSGGFEALEKTDPEASPEARKSTGLEQVRQKAQRQGYLLLEDLLAARPDLEANMATWKSCSLTSSIRAWKCIQT